MADDGRKSAPRTWDLFSLLAGIATLFVSFYILTDAHTWLGEVALRWLLAGGAVAVGVLMLVSSMRPRKRER
nr:hypothetical protein [Saccharomonospora glauca]